LIGTTSAAMLDFLFKSNAALEFGSKSPALLRFFALFYTGAQVLTFIVQTILSRFALEKLGLSRTVGSLPFAVGAGSIMALVVPVFATIASARGLELILRGSLFRAGYELFYTAVPPRDKRAVKVLIDVGCDRTGDALGAGIVQIAIWLGPDLARTELLFSAIVLALVAAWIASRLDKAYTVVLERGLIQRAIELDFTDIHDSTTRGVILRSTNLSKPVAAVVPKTGQPVVDSAPRRALITDPVIDIFTTLRSSDSKLVEDALRKPESEDTVLAPQLIKLLAWDDIVGSVHRRLMKMAPRIVGQLSDALLDQDEDFAIRRRIPRLLARSPHSQRAAEALCEALNDSRFEVRFQCGRALDAMRQQNPGLKIREEAIYAVVERELSVSKTIWEGHRLLDHREVAGTESSDRFSFLDEILRERANQSLEHIFSLLTLVLPRDPLQVAFRALHTDDRQIRALALEYLENVLPSSIRAKLWAVIQETHDAAEEKTPKQVLDALMLSNASLQLKIRSELSDPKGKRIGPEGSALS
jgi:AAA family ATP:ADP antiporter